MKSLKRFLNQLFCRHDDRVDWWRFTHGANNNEPRYIYGMRVCAKCGKEIPFTVRRGSAEEAYIIEHMVDKQI